MSKRQPDQHRRVVTRIITAGTAFVAPLVISITASGLHFNQALARPVGVPEPSSISLLAAGVAGVAVVVALRRKTRK